MADPEICIRGDQLTALEGVRSSQTSVIPYIIHQIFPTKKKPPPFQCDSVNRKHDTTFNMVSYFKDSFVLVIKDWSKLKVKVKCKHLMYL